MPASKTTGGLGGVRDFDGMAQRLLVPFATLHRRKVDTLLPWSAVMAAHHHNEWVWFLADR
jgi:hypothetical protein